MDLKVNDIKSKDLPIINKTKEVTLDNDFKFTLNKVEDDNLMAKLNSLINEITSQSEKISKHMDIRDMKKYKSLITDFMNEVVTNSHEFSRKNFLDRRGRHRVYGIVKLVNKELDDLAQNLLNSEKKQIDILDKTGEIRGLLLDLII